MFDNVETWTKQGDIGEAKAIYEYTRLGYTVSRTIFDSARYDLIVDKNNQLIRVQVKTATTIRESGYYRVWLMTTGSSKTKRSHRPRSKNDYDELFVLCETGDYYIIPVTKFSAVNQLTLNKRFDKYKNLG